jgi:hypothetical protein
MIGSILGTLGQVGGFGLAKGVFGNPFGGSPGVTPPTTMPGAAVQTGSGLNIGGIDQGINATIG